MHKSLKILLLATAILGCGSTFASLEESTDGTVGSPLPNHPSALTIHGGSDALVTTPAPGTMLAFSPGRVRRQLISAVSTVDDANYSAGVHATGLVTMPAVRVWNFPQPQGTLITTDAVRAIVRQRNDVVSRLADIDDACGQLDEVVSLPEEAGKVVVEYGKVLAQLTEASVSTEERFVRVNQRIAQSGTGRIITGARLLAEEITTMKSRLAALRYVNTQLDAFESGPLVNIEEAARSVGLVVGTVQQAHTSGVTPQQQLLSAAAHGDHDGTGSPDHHSASQPRGLDEGSTQEIAEE